MIFIFFKVSVELLCAPRSKTRINLVFQFKDGAVVTGVEIAVEREGGKGRKRELGGRGG